MSYIECISKHRVLQNLKRTKPVTLKMKFPPVWPQCFFSFAQHKQTPLAVVDEISLFWCRSNAFEHETSAFSTVVSISSTYAHDS